MADLYGYVAWSFLCWAALNPNKTYIQVVQIAFLNFSKPEQEFDLLSPVAPCQSSPFSFSPLQRSSCMTYFRWVLTSAWHCKQTSPVLSYLTPHWAPPHTASLEVFRLDGALSNLIWWKVSLYTAGDWNKTIFKVPSNSNLSMIFSTSSENRSEIRVSFHNTATEYGCAFA